MDRFRMVFRTEGLGGQSAGAHADEAECPVEHVDQRAPDRDGADIHDTAQMTRDSQVDQAKQRNRDVGRDGRNSYFKNPLVHPKSPYFRKDGRSSHTADHPFHPCHLSGHKDTALLGLSQAESVPSEYLPQ